MPNSGKDIRVIQMRNYGKLKKNEKINQKGTELYLTFSYFDSINIIPIKNVSENNSLFDAYNKIQENLSFNDKSYYAQQLVLAFSDYSDLNFQTQERIEEFWNKKDNALLFVTMINVSLEYGISDALKRIKNIFKSYESNYLVYLTFEYNEIIIFFKGNRFDEYSKLIMELNFKSMDSDNPIVDTITICSFSKDECNYCKEHFGAHICLGTDNYNSFSEFLNDFEKDNGKFDQKWLLGRNDIEIWKPKATLAWMSNFYKSFLRQDKANITTYKLSILIPKDNEVSKSLLDSNLALSPSVFNLDVKNTFVEKMANVDKHYKDFCKRVNMSYDPVLIRMLYDTISVISGIYEHQYAEDLFICLYTQVKDFIEYLDILFCNSKIEEAEALELSKCVNSFYLSNISLINSTVHTSQQFIQIPHCAPPAFEMPPKIMAYYNTIVRKIQHVFQDDDTFCGIIISPKLVDELEVDSLALEDTEPNQLISINISEKMMYNLKRTASILAHELAHFIGNDTRNRNMRGVYIGAYFISKILIEVDEKLYDLMGYDENIETNTLEAEDFSDFSFELSTEFFGGIKDNDIYLYKRKLIYLFKNLPSRLLQDASCKNHILNSLYKISNPNKMAYIKNIEKSLQSKVLIPERCDNFFESTKKLFLQNHFKSLFSTAVNDYINSNSLEKIREKLENQIENYVGYLFAETYADISMILLFGMIPDEYISLIVDKTDEIYRCNINEDKIELMRFIAVTTALNRCDIWKEMGCTKQYNKGTWSQVMYNFISVVNIEKDFINLSQSYNIDLILLTYLVNYLKKCIKDIDLKLKKKENEISLLREFYHSVDEDKPLSEILTKMREYEKEAFDKSGI